jgi:hypothetical protein
MCLRSTSYGVFADQGQLSVPLDQVRESIFSWLSSWRTYDLARMKPLTRSSLLWRLPTETVGQQKRPGRRDNIIHNHEREIVL